MDKNEAIQIPDLQIEPDGPTEDWFFLLMTAKGKVSKEQGKKALERIKEYSQEESAKALMKAEKMEANLEKYGVPCAEWLQ